MKKHIKQYVAEGLGTMLLVVFGCGVASVTGATGADGLVATALAFGLILTALVYCVGNVSGCHVNPAVTLAMLISGKISVIVSLWYLFSQILGATLGALIVALFTGGFANLGGNAVQPLLIGAFGDGALGVALIAEMVLTFAFVFVILGVTSRKENKSTSGIVIGFALTVVHLLGIRLTGTSVNPARSIGPALMQIIGGDFTAISQVWIFIVGPLLGAALAAVVKKLLDPPPRDELRDA